MRVQWWKVSAVLGWGAAAAFALSPPARQAAPVTGAPAGALRAQAAPPWRPWVDTGVGLAGPGARRGLDALTEARTPSATCTALQGLGAGTVDDVGAAVHAVRRLLDGRPRRDVRECIIGALANLGGPTARDALDELRQDGSHSVRLAALTVLAQSLEPGAFEIVARQSKDGDPGRRHEALVALGRAGYAEAIPRLAEAIDEVGGDARDELIDALGNAGEGAVGPLVRLLEHPAEQVQASAARALTQASSADAIRALERALLDGTTNRSGTVRVASMLAELGDDGQRVLREAAQSPSAEVRDAAQRALLDAGGEVAREQIEGWLASSDKGNINLALNYLQQHAGEAPLPAHLTTLARERPDFAMRVTTILSQAGGEAARAALRELAEGTGVTRSLALQGLSGVPGEAAWARTRLVQAAREEGGRAADLAFEALADDGSSEARDALIAAGREGGVAAGRALATLARFPDADASRALAEAAREATSASNRSAALSALADRNDPVARRAVIGALEAWRKPGAALPDPGVVAQICAGLVAQGAPEGERALRAFADSPKARDWGLLAGVLSERERPLPLPLDLTEKLAGDVERPYADSALRMLAERDVGRARSLVEGLSRSNEEGSREYAVRSSELLLPGERSRLLQGALLDRNEAVVMAAVRELENGGGLADQAALAGLLAQGAAPPDALALAARALRDLGGEPARQHHDLIERYGGPEDNDEGGDTDGDAGVAEIGDE